MTATSKLRGFLCAVAAMWCVGSTPASATAFQVTFDPEVLYGTLLFDVSAPCLANNNNYDTPGEILGLLLSGCTISLLNASVSITGDGGPFTNYTAELPFVLFSSLLIIDHQFAGITTLVPIRLEPIGGDIITSSLLTGSLQDDCDATISLTAAGSVSFVGCGPNGPLPPLGGTVTAITRVPEPGTLGLLFGAGIAAWWVRRRRFPAERRVHPVLSA